jgi:hypothetical protein
LEEKNIKNNLNINKIIGSEAEAEAEAEGINITFTR